MLIILFFVASAAMTGWSQDQPSALSFTSFVEMATTKDTEFEQILLDELILKYQKNLKLPAKDLILSVKQQYEIYVSQDRGSPDTTIKLSKLFPYSGTGLALDYKVGALVTSANQASELAFTIAQPIAENAFGRSTRLLDKIVGLEVEVASHQIVEAYEDYLATIMTSYYTWYGDYENLLIGQASYKENSKLLDSMLEREKQKIALPIDVNKVRLQVLSKKERLTELEEKYKNSLNIIQRIIRDLTTEYIPQEPALLTQIQLEFDEIFKHFKSDSRTFAILNKLEAKSSLVVARDADDLLPSINMIAGYQVNGDDYGLKNEDNFVFAGIALEWPLTEQVEKAEYEMSKIGADKQKLITINTYYRLYAQLQNLYLQIQRETSLIQIAEERIDLAKLILTDEKENYSFGKVTLNDYIQAFNDLDANRFNKILHDVQYRKLLVEWLRLQDQLVEKQTIMPQINQMKKRSQSQ